MQVIMLEDVRKVGKKDEIVKVADGYARNFLFPKNLAVPLNDNNLKVLQAKKDKRAADEQQLQKEARELKDQIEKQKLEFKLNVGKEGNAFGKVSGKQIAKALEDQGILIDKRKIIFDTPVDTLLTKNLKIDLYK